VVDVSHLFGLKEFAGSEGISLSEVDEEEGAADETDPFWSV
jgi:hypothetical protein